MIDKEQLNTIKYLIIGSFIFMIAGVIGSVLLRRDSPGLARIVKTGGFIIGIIIFAGGILWVIAGETISKKLKNRKTPKQTQQEYAAKLVLHKQKMEEMQLQTALKIEEAKQKQMENRLQMQKAQINQMNAKAKSMGGGSGSMDVLGNLSGILTSTQQKPQQESDLNQFMGVKKNNNKKPKKKVKPKNNKNGGVDDFFIKF